jgi:hypothetical protein
MPPAVAYPHVRLPATRVHDTNNVRLHALLNHLRLVGTQAKGRIMRISHVRAHIVCRLKVICGAFHEAARLF